MPDMTSTSGGVNLPANSNTIGGDVVGRDKIVQITNTIVQQAQAAMGLTEAARVVSGKHGLF